MGTSSLAPTAAALRGDEAELFRAHHRTLLRLVARDVEARPPIIEDACAFAWLERVARQPDRTRVVGWLRVVARREAIRLAAHDRRRAALDPHHADPSATAAAERRGEAVEALRTLAALPPRKRAALALQVSGCSYREIGELLQMTPRTVERQVLRGRATARRNRDRDRLAA